MSFRLVHLCQWNLWIIFQREVKDDSGVLGLEKQSCYLQLAIDWHLLEPNEAWSFGARLEVWTWLRLIQEVAAGGHCVPTMGLGTGDAGWHQEGKDIDLFPKSSPWRRAWPWHQSVLAAWRMVVPETCWGGMHSWKDLQTCQCSKIEAYPVTELSYRRAVSDLNSVYSKILPSLPLKILFLLPCTYAQRVEHFPVFLWRQRYRPLMVINSVRFFFVCLLVCLSVCFALFFEDIHLVNTQR